MTFFLGSKGSIQLRRALSITAGVLKDSISPDDVNTSLNRVSFGGAGQNLLTGDKVDITTTDPRGLLFLPPNVWTSNQVEAQITAYVNVNAAGGLRIFTSFVDAVNNNRAVEIPLTAFNGTPLDVTYTVRDVSYTVLGNVTGYSLTTDRESIDATSLSDKFRKMFSAGIISGSGSIDCVFDYTTSGLKETPLLMLQLIHRLDIGSEFKCGLYLTDRDIDPSVQSVFYLVDAMVTKAGINATADDVIRCSIDFVSTGEIQLLVGQLPEYILKEQDDDRIYLEQTLDFLLKELED